MFRCTRARLQQQARTSGFLMEAYIRMRLTHFKELARTMDEDPELSSQRVYRLE